MPHREEFPNSLQIPSFTVIGHRGAAGLLPENTLPSFDCALDWGCPMLELDVHRVLGRDGKEHLVVIHDEELKRTTNGRGEVAKTTLEALRKLDAGNGAQIPLLAEVAELLANRRASHEHNTVLNIELKGGNTAELTARFIAANPDLPALVSSFDHRQLTTFRAFDEHTAVAPLYHKYTESWRETAAALRATGVNLGSNIATPARVQAIREAGLMVFVYTVNDPEIAIKLKEAGASGVFTDRPDLMAQAGFVQSQ